MFEFVLYVFVVFGCFFFKKVFFNVVFILYYFLFMKGFFIAICFLVRQWKQSEIVVIAKKMNAVEKDDFTTESDGHFV